MRLGTSGSVFGWTSKASSTTDAAFIPYYNQPDFTLSDRVYRWGDTSNFERISQVALADRMSLNARVVRYGVSSGITVGTISRTDASVQYVYNGNTITMHNVVRYSNVPIEGDSGGPVFIQQSGSTPLYLAAINHGYGNDSGVTYGYGTKVVDASFLLDINAKTISGNPYFGDVDGNGVVNTTDAQLALAFSVGKTTPTTAQINATDVECDGDITGTDARLILQRATGAI